MKKLLSLLGIICCLMSCNTYMLCISDSPVQMHLFTGFGYQDYGTPESYNFIVGGSYFIEKILPHGDYSDVVYGDELGYIYHGTTGLTRLGKLSKRKYVKKYKQNFYLYSYNSRLIKSKYISQLPNERSDNGRHSTPAYNQTLTNTPSYNWSPSSTYTPSSDGRVHVRGYYRKDGTYVRPYTRSYPHRK